MIAETDTDGSGTVDYEGKHITWWKRFFENGFKIDVMYILKK